MSEEIQMLGGFKLLGTLKGSGDGRQGTVYRAECVRETVAGVAVGEVVVLKTMKNDDDSGRSFAKLKKRTETLASLEHPNILRYRGCFSDIGPLSSLDVVVTDLLEGETLKERLAANPGGLDADEAVRIAEGALAGLCCAAKAGIVHRDIKPGNIFLCKDGTVKLIDFELGRAANTTITASGSFVGTFNYMAPEFSDDAFRGDETSDVFSMGVVFHEALTGVLPYAKDRDRGEQADFAFLSRWKQRMEGLCVIHVKSAVKRLLFSADEVLRKALSEDRSTRYATAEEFCRGVESIRFKELDNDAGNVYRLLRLIGKGGFGEVFKARDRMGRVVAVKRLLDERYGARFAKEARIMRKLDDPAFVRFVDYFEKRSAGCTEAYLVMDFLPGMPGSSLRDAIKGHPNEPLPYKDVMTAFALYARGLAMMHMRGIYHRDIKPSNLYYPASDVTHAAIMDLGIARDVNGSVTTDQVPGTLDYMPYEIAFGTSRGDSAMDVYALGLSLYEALTSKTAFPRLQAGRAGVEGFLQRARDRILPNFDAPQVVRRPALLQLLRDMTNLDSSLRIRDADVVRRRIEELVLAVEVPVRQNPKPRSAERSRPTFRLPPLPPPLPEPATQNTDITRPAPRLQSFGALVAKSIFAALVIGGLAIGVKVAWGPAAALFHQGVDKVSEWKREKAQKEIDERNLLEEERERVRIDKKRADAELEAASVVNRYADSGVAVMSAGLAAEEWRAKWRGDTEVADVFDRATNDFEQAKLDRMRMDERIKAQETHDVALRENESICAAYSEADLVKPIGQIDTRADEWRTKWNGAIAADLYARMEGNLSASRQDRVDRARRREMEKEVEAGWRRAIDKAEKEATAQANRIVADFADESIMPTKSDACYVRWQSDFGAYADQPFYAKSAARIESARRERGMLESGRAVSKECDRWLANIETVSEFNVKNWRDNITQAELELKKALNPRNQRISERLATEVRKRIEERKKWKVGVIDNKTSRTVRLGEGVIGPTSSGTIIFRSGFPVGAAITSEGCEPVRIREDLFDARTFILLPRMLVERKSGVRAVVPTFGDDVVCLIDGVEAHPGEITISKDSVHHVLYRRLAQTYAGIDDYKEQDIVFRTDGGATVQIPRPHEDWSVSEEYQDAAKSAKLIARGEKIVAQIEKLLEPEPVSTRRTRLEKVHAVLTHWETASALAALGASVESALKQKYEDECRRVRGTVRNETAYEASLATDCATVRIPAGKAEMVTFERSWPGESYVSVPNYEFMFLPRSSIDFDGKEFVVEVSRLTPLPVRVFLPPLEKGVVCRVAGKLAESELRLRPGNYECVYMKPDCVSQKFEISVNVGEDMTLPAPRAWVPSGALSSLAAAIDSFNSGAIGAAKSLADKIGTIEDPSRRRELEDLKKAIELRERLENADIDRKDQGVL